MVARRRSVPSGAVSSVQNTTLPDTTNPFPTPAPSQQQPAAQIPLLRSQADTLARMTFELNLRTVNVQADRLERDVRALKVATAHDKEFRGNFDVRLQAMRHEIAAVKKRMEEVQGEQGDARADFERCQAETAVTRKMFKQEVSELKDLVESISSQMDQLPTMAEINEGLLDGTSRSTDTEARALIRAQRWAAQTSHQDSGERPLIRR